MLALLAFQRRQLAAPVRILCRHTICSLWVATPQPPFGCCISLYRSDYLLTLSRPSHFHPLGCTLLRSGFPRRFDSRYTFKNVLLFLHRHIQTDSPSSSRVSLFLHVSASLTDFNPFHFVHLTTYFIILFYHTLVRFSSITFKLRTVLTCIDLQGFHRFHEVYAAGQWRILPSFKLSSMA